MLAGTINLNLSAMIQLNSLCFLVENDLLHNTEKESEIRNQFRMIFSDEGNLISDLVLSYLFFLPNNFYPSKPLPVIKKIEILYGPCDRIGFSGLGRPLTEQDIGKKMVRAAPVDGDWSFIPSSKKLPEIIKESSEILDVKPTYITQKGILTNKLTLKWNNDWCTPEQFFEAVQKYVKPISLFQSLFIEARPLRSSPSRFFSQPSVIAIPPFPTDYHQRCPRIEAEERRLDETQEKARKTLNLKPGENVKEKFKALAKNLHPDKSNDPEAKEKFRELLDAFQCLSSLKSSNLNFVVSKEASVDEMMDQAEFFYQNLLKEETFLTLKQRIQTWLDFHSTLKDLEDKYPLLKDLQKIVSDRLIYYKLVDQLESIDVETDKIFQLPYEKIAESLKDLCSEVQNFIKNFDLANERDSWNVSQTSYFELANARILDLFIALKRSHVESFLNKGQRVQAEKVAKEALQFYRKHTDKVSSAKLQSLADKMLKVLLNKDEKPKIESPEEPKADELNIEPFRNEAKSNKNSKEQVPLSPPSEPSLIEKLKKNCSINLLFLGKLCPQFN